jgi:hypothetical protein
LRAKIGAAALLGAATLLLLPAPAGAGGLLASGGLEDLLAQVLEPTTAAATEAVSTTLPGGAPAVTETVVATVDTTVTETARGIDATVADASATVTGAAISTAVLTRQPEGAGHAAGALIGHAAGLIERTTGRVGRLVFGLADRADDVVADTLGVDLLPEEPQPVPLRARPRTLQPPDEPAPGPPQSKARTKPAPQGASREPAEAGKRPPARPAARPGRQPPERGGLRTIKDLAFPIVLALAVATFLALQHHIDKRDPKLTRAPLDDDLLSFS